MNYIIVVAVLGGVAYRIATPEERERYFALAMLTIRRLKVAVTQPGPEYDAFRDALRERTSSMFVMPAIALMNIAVFAGLLFGGRAMTDGATLLDWGASLGTRTTNGEWWRLLTSSFVHTAMLQLLVSIAVLIQIGGMIERLAGRLLLAVVYLSAGVFAGLADISSHPIAVTIGAPAAIFGLYGFVLAPLLRHLRRHVLGHERTDHIEAVVPDTADGHVTIPFVAVKRIGIGAAAFIVYSAASGHAHAAEFIGALVGLTYGLVLTRRVSEQQPPMGLVVFGAAAAAIVAVALAFPHRHIADVESEIARVLAIEARTSAAYQAGADALKKGRATSDALAQLAERTIVPELQAADVRLKLLTNVPQENQDLVANAREYLRLRCASWHARADALRTVYQNAPPPPEGGAHTTWRLQATARFRSNMAALGAAEAAERAALEAFRRIKPSAESPPIAAIDSHIGTKF